MDEHETLLSLLDGLKARGLLARAQVVKAGECLVQLSSDVAPGAPADDPRDVAKREREDEEDRIYGAS